MQRPETKARARALQLLYAWELSGRPTIEAVVARVAVIYGGAPLGYDRGADLAAKAIAGLPEFDRRIADAAEHWRLERVGAVERNILRIAIRECVVDNLTPVGAAINEAVDLAKKYGSDSSGSFVNGVLGTISAGRPATEEGD